MKTNFILLPLSAIALISCEKEIPSSNSDSCFENRIVFQVCPLTKAYSEANAQTLKTAGFKVAGVASGESSAFFNEAAAWNSTSSCYKTSNNYYYPSSDNTAFYAVYPSDETITISSGKGTVSYTSDVKDDLMSAYALCTSSDDPVSLQFGHALSQVCIKAKGSDSNFTYKVSSVSLSGKGSGVLDISTASWTSVSGSKDESYFTGSKEVSTSEYSSFSVDNMAFIPKGDGTDGTDALKLTVEYQVLSGSTVVSDFTGSAAKSIKVNLKQGKRCVVNCSLPTGTLTPITFTVGVDSWEDAEAQTVEL